MNVEVLLVDAVHHCEHLARSQLLVLSVRREIERRCRLALFANMAIGAAHAERLGKELHRSEKLPAGDVLREESQVLVRRVGEGRLRRRIRRRRLCERDRHAASHCGRRQRECWSPELHQRFPL